NRLAEEKRIRGRTPDQAHATGKKLHPRVLCQRDAVDQHRARPQTPEGFKPCDFVGGWFIDPFGGMNNERAGGRWRPMFFGDAAAAFAIRADGPAFEGKGVSPSKLPDDTNRKLTPQVAIQRVVMSDGGDTRKHILQAADEQSIAQRIAAVLSDVR